jgi:hypothetical protein
LLGRLLDAMMTIDPVATDPSGSGSGFGLGIQREGRFPYGEAWGHDGEPAGLALINLLVTAYCGA